MTKNARGAPRHSTPTGGGGLGHSCRRRRLRRRQRGLQRRASDDYLLLCLPQRLTRCRHLPRLLRFRGQGRLRRRTRTTCPHRLLGGSTRTRGRGRCDRETENRYRATAAPWGFQETCMRSIVLTLQSLWSIEETRRAFCSNPSNKTKSRTLNPSSPDRPFRRRSEGTSHPNPSAARYCADYLCRRACGEWSTVKMEICPPLVHSEQRPQETSNRNDCLPRLPRPETGVSIYVLDGLAVGGVLVAGVRSRQPRVRPLLP